MESVRTGPRGPHPAPGALAPIIAALAAGALTAFAPAVFNDGDTWMHIAAGMRMLDAGAVLRVDPFSYTFAGRPWQTHEWLAEVAMALAWRAGGWAGEALLFGAAAAATAGLLTRHAGRWLSGAPLAALVALSLGALAPSLLARPHLLALPCLELWTAELVIARADGRAPRAPALAAIMVVWANLHGSFIFGLGLLGAFGLEGLSRDRRAGLAALRPWLAPGMAALAATVASPHGLDNLTFPLRLTGMTTLAGVTEWGPLTLTDNRLFEAALLGGAAALIWTRARVPALHLLLLLGLADLAFEHQRHVLLFGVVAPLLIAGPLGERLPRPAARRGAGPWVPALGVMAALALAAGRIALGGAPADSRVNPGAALAHVPAPLRALPTFNAYPFGGFLIFNGVRPYIDSRAEVYGDAFRNGFLRLEDGDAAAFREEAARRGFGWTILEPGAPLVAALDASPDWRRLYADRFAVVHVRRGPPAAGRPDVDTGPPRRTVNRGRSTWPATETSSH
jgi:hypothetical protein